MNTEPIEIPGFVWSALGLASVTISNLVDPEQGILTKLHEQGVSSTYEAVRAVDAVLREAIEGATGGQPWESPQAEAMIEFLSASIAACREVDDYEMDGALPYEPASKRLAAAWERYRKELDRKDADA